MVRGEKKKKKERERGKRKLFYIKIMFKEAKVLPEI
jgi:hypothetical protein